MISWNLVLIGDDSEDKLWFLEKFLKEGSDLVKQRVQNLEKIDISARTICMVTYLYEESQLELTVFHTTSDSVSLGLSFDKTTCVDLTGLKRGKKLVYYMDKKGKYDTHENIKISKRRLQITSRSAKNDIDSLLEELLIRIVERKETESNSGKVVFMESMLKRPEDASVIPSLSESRKVEV